VPDIEKTGIQEASWHCVSFLLLFILLLEIMTKETMEKLCFITEAFPKFYSNQTNILIKREKNLIQKEANKFFNVSKFCIDILQLERVNLSDVLLDKKTISVTIHVILSNNNNNIIFVIIK